MHIYFNESCNAWVLELRGPSGYWFVEGYFHSKEDAEQHLS